MMIIETRGGEAEIGEGNIIETEPGQGLPGLIGGTGTWMKPNKLKNKLGSMKLP